MEEVWAALGPVGTDTQVHAVTFYCYKPRDNYKGLNDVKWLCPENPGNFSTAPARGYSLGDDWLRTWFPDLLISLPHVCTLQSNRAPRSGPLAETVGHLPKSILAFLPKWQDSNGPDFSPTLFPFHCCPSVPVRPNAWVSESPCEGKLSSRIHTELLCEPAVKNSVVFDHVHWGLAGPNSPTTFSSTAGNRLWITVYSIVQPQ